MGQIAYFYIILQSLNRTAKNESGGAGFDGYLAEWVETTLDECFKTTELQVTSELLSWFSKLCRFSDV